MPFDSRNISNMPIVEKHALFPKLSVHGSSDRTSHEFPHISYSFWVFIVTCIVFTTSLETQLYNHWHDDGQQSHAQGYPYFQHDLYIL